jgi:hypothetical protein
MRANAAEGDQLRIGGAGPDQGKLQFVTGTERAPSVGTTVLEPKTWYHVTVVRDTDRVRVYLNGRSEPDLVGAVPLPSFGDAPGVTVGDNGAAESAFEGKLSEVAVFDRPLTTQEISQHVAAAAVRESAN